MIWEVRKLIDFQQLVDDSVQARPPREKDINSINVSALGGCMRKTWYSYYINRPYGKDTLKIFVVGDLIHDWVTKELMKKVRDKDSPLKWVAAEEPTSFGIEDGEHIIRLAGRLDDYITEINGERYIVEKKSTRTVQYTKEPYPAHLMQIMVYMGARGIKKGILVYFSKQDMQVKQFNIDYDEKLFKRALQRTRDIHRHLRTKTLPIPEDMLDKKKRNWSCKGCPYKAECYFDSKDVIDSEELIGKANRGFWAKARKADEESAQADLPKPKSQPKSEKLPLNKK